MSERGGVWLREMIQTSHIYGLAHQQQQNTMKRPMTRVSYVLTQ